MLAYKMVNTLDSMIGYRNERYREFGCFAARLDDVANWIPARITALLMAVGAQMLGTISAYKAQQFPERLHFPPLRIHLWSHNSVAFSHLIWSFSPHTVMSPSL